MVKQEQQGHVNLVKLSDKEESTTKVPFVFKELPQTAEALVALLDQYQQDSVVLKRLRDYHHPDGTLTDKGDKLGKWQKYNKFVMAVLSHYSESEQPHILEHLQEMASNPDVAKVIVQYLTLRLKTIVELLKDLREVDTAELGKFLKVFRDCQKILIHVLKIPQCKVLDLIMSISG
jgi:hypothetical protein